MSMAEENLTGFCTTPSHLRIRSTIFWNAKYLSWSAVVGRPNSAAGKIVARASIWRPSSVRIWSATLLDFTRRRLLEGVKNPNVFKFFSTRTISRVVGGAGSRDG